MGTQVQRTSGTVDFGAGTCPEGFEIRSMALPTELADQMRAAVKAMATAEQRVKDAITAAGGMAESYRILHGTDTVQFLVRTAEAEG